MVKDILKELEKKMKVSTEHVKKIEEFAATKEKEILER